MANKRKISANDNTDSRSKGQQALDRKRKGKQDKEEKTAGGGKNRRQYSLDSVSSGVPLAGPGKPRKEKFSIGGAASVEGRRQRRKTREQRGLEQDMSQMLLPPSARAGGASPLSHPLMELSSSDGAHVCLLGNRSLISLNLSRNLIGEPGLTKLLEMAQVISIQFNSIQFK